MKTTYPPFCRGCVNIKRGLLLQLTCSKKCKYHPDRSMQSWQSFYIKKVNLPCSDKSSKR
jgi:hypothetical protein